MTRSAQAISTHMTDFPGNRAAKARVARCQGRAEVTDAEDPLAKIKLHRRLDRCQADRRSSRWASMDRPGGDLGRRPRPRTVPASGIPGRCPPTENGSMERINPLTSCD